MSTSETCEIISSNIDIAQNEYVTKYSFNRNFEKLLSNDAILDRYSLSSDIETYNKHKTYSNDQLVLYKIHKTDPNLYLLCSMTTPNMHKPRVRQDFQTNKLYVISSEYWSIVGGIDSDGTQMASKDVADKIVSTNKTTFIQNHQENESLNAHPTGKLGMKDSSILFRTFTNISDEKQHFFYPYELRSFVANDSIYSGYMRKWDNGLLEYDIIFRLSYAGKADDGSDIISANNYHALHQNNNFMYFKTDDDYAVFSRGDEYYANVNGTKHVNLNRTINAYSSKVEFIEPFKDLNYMVFTSNVKNIETEAYNNKIEAIDNYDKRLQINGLTIIGLEPNATFRLELKIPNQIVNIKRHALSDMKKSQGYPIPLTIDPYSSNLVNIDNEAFLMSEIDTISFPYSLRYIGKDAFSGCNSLTSVVFHVERDPKLQPKIDYNAFNDTNIQSISVIYKTDSLMMFRSAADQIDQPYRDLMYNNDDNLHTKFNNTNYRTNVGIRGVPTIYVENAPVSRTLMANFNSSYDTVLSNDIECDAVSNEVSSESQMITIDVNEFLAELSSMKQSKLMSSTLLRANVPPTIDEGTLFKIDSAGIITGFNNDVVLSDAIEFDISESSKIKGIGSGALDDAHKLTSLSIGSNITSIASDAFGVQFNNLFITKLGTDLNTPDTTFNSLCILDPNGKKIFADIIDNLWYLNGNVPSKAVHANVVNNLHVISAGTIQTSAFWQIEKIENAYLNSNNSTAVLLSNVFKSTIENEYDTKNTTLIVNSWYECNVDKIDLQGTCWTLGPSSLIGFDVDYLSVNIYNGYIASNAICSSDINMFKIYDLLNANGDTDNGYRGIYSHAFNNSYIANIEFPDITSNISALSSVLRYSTHPAATSAVLTSIGILSSSPMIITTANDTKMFYENQILSTLQYLGIKSNTILTSITTKISADEYDGQVLIPNYITTIGDGNKLTQNTSSISSITKIIVPNSVTSIKNNAFSGLTALEDIVFEPGIQLSSIGSNIFKGCINLKDVVFP